MVQVFKKSQSLFLLGFLFLLFFFHFDSAHSYDSTTSSRGTRNFGLFSNNRAAKELEDKIMCAFETQENIKMPSMAYSRAQYMAKHMSRMFSRIHPDWGDTVVRHMIAQSIIETDYLRAVTEYKSTYASSRKKHKGRGGCQTTHMANYAKLNACSNKIMESEPSRISLFEVAYQPVSYRVPLVINPAQTMSERTEMGQIYNAMSCPCYFINTAMRHKRFADALQCESEACVMEVGVGVNRGPGNLGKKMRPLKHYYRYKVFKEIGHCFNGRGPIRTTFDTSFGTSPSKTKGAAPIFRRIRDEVQVLNGEKR